MKLNLPLWAQIAANLLSLALALYLGWKPELILFLFWAENIIIGIWQIPRLLLAGSATEFQSSKPIEGLFIVAFFCVHYGIFTFVHGIFVFQLFLHQPLNTNSLTELIFSTQGMKLALLGIFASHAAQFFQEMLKGEVRRRKRETVMMSPYKRIVILHLVLIGSGFLLIQLPNPLIAVILLFSIKIMMDIASERKAEKQQEAHVT